MWVHGPGKEPWEVYVVKADADTLGKSADPRPGRRLLLRSGRRRCPGGGYVHSRPPGVTAHTRFWPGRAVLICDTGRVMPKPGELTFVAPRGAKKPPRHLADLSPAERKDAVAEAGEKPFRAKQLSQHYFARYAHDPEQWTDIPAGVAGEAAGGAVPGPDVGGPASGRPGDHPQDAVAAVRRHAGRVRADAVPGPGHHVHQLAGRVRHELPVLRDRAGGAGPEPVHRRDRAPDRGRDAGAPGRRGPRRPGAAVQHRLHGHGRAARQLQARRRRHPRPHRPRPRRPRHVAARHHRVDRRAWSPPSTASPTRASSAGWRSPCTPPTTNCATPSSP